MLEVFLSRLIGTGSLVVALPSGRRLVLGDGSGTPVAIRIRDRRTALRLALNPELAFGESYVDGGLVVEAGGLWDLVDLVGRNLASRPRQPPSWVARVRRALEQANSRRVARRNVAHHYELGLDLYRRFLDADLQYSCAYFSRPGLSLDAAQRAKKDRLVAKLFLRRGDRVLDIGCGWGGLALTLAQEGARVTGITLSQEQLTTARRRAAARGLSDRAQFRLQDFREVEGPFDRIVSVGMFEHVGYPNYDAYFAAIARLLTENGVAVVHAIGCREPTTRTQPWIRKYIFPGGYMPALSEVLPAIERAGLWVTDLEILRLHYAETLAAWRARFAAARAEVAQAYGERFCRMWEFYLCLSEIGFRYRGLMVFQVQLTKRVDALPLTRDYMAGRTDDGTASPDRTGDLQSHNFESTE